MTQLTEHTAWRRIARNIEKRGRSDGLCIEMIILRRDGRIDWETGERMQRRINDHKEPNAVYAFDSETDTARILAAQLLAIEAEREYRQERRKQWVTY